MIDDAVQRIARMRSKPWLVLGKGPSLDLRVHFDLDHYYTFALNHACKVHTVTLAHFMDMEALNDCFDDVIFAQPPPTVAMPYVPQLVMPWIPHKDMGPSHYNLTDYIAQGNKPLRWASVHDKLWSYNSSRVPRSRHHPDLPPVRVRYFSAVAAINLLALAGVKKIHTLGIDGGNSYAGDFDTRHCLANGQKSFDVQFGEINRTLRLHRIEWINLADTLDE